MPININKRSDVNSVNGKVGDVMLNASDIGALSKDTKIPSKTSELINDSNYVADSDYKHTDNNYTTTDKNSVATIGNKVDKVEGKGLSTNDLTDELKADYDDAVLQAHTHSNKTILDNTTASYTTEERTKLSGIENNAQKNTVIGVKGEVETDYRVGNVNITKENIGLENVANERQWSETNHPTTISGYGITDSASSTDYNTLKGRVDTNEDNIAMLDSDVESLTTDVGMLETDMTTVKSAVTTIQDDYVPKTRKVNGKSLSADITLSASDVKAIPISQKGTSNGVAELDGNGLVPSSQLPSYVDDVLEYDTKTDFPTNGESGKIYIATDTNLQYRWTGTQYAEISSSLALGETSSTAYRGDRGKIAYDHSQKASGNPHNVTKSDVGLGNVGNFKAVSTVASQGLTDTEKANARANIGAGTGNSNFSGSYNDLTNKPALGTAATKNVPASGNATTDEIVMGNDSRLTNSRPASDVYSWAKASTKPSYTKSEIGLGNVGNYKAVSTVANQQLSDSEKAAARANIGAGTGSSNFSGAYADLSGRPTLGTASSKDVAASGDASNSQVVMGNDTRLTNSRPASDVAAWAKAATKPAYTASEVGLGNVGNFKAVSTVASQGLTSTEKANARANIGAGTGNSNFSGAYADLSGKPTLGSAAAKDVASSGNATNSQVVMGNDTRLTNARPASDVSAWAKAASKPSYTWDEITNKPTSFSPYFANTTWYLVGDDVYIGDHDQAGGLGIWGANGNTKLDFCQFDNNSNFKSITFDGTTLYLDGNCYYASQAGNADTLDGNHASAFATSSHTHSYADLSGRPTLGTAASKNVPASGNASTNEVVLGNDTRLTDARKASDVYSWAKASVKPSYTKSEIGLGNVDNTADAEKSVKNADKLYNKSNDYYGVWLGGMTILKGTEAGMSQSVAEDPLHRYIKPTSIIDIYYDDNSVQYASEIGMLYNIQESGGVYYLSIAPKKDVVKQDIVIQNILVRNP